LLYLFSEVANAVLFGYYLPMIKKFQAIGGSLGLVIEKPVAELFGIDRDTAFELTTEGADILKIRILRNPVEEKKKRDAKIDEIMKDTKQRFGKMMKNLAK
jgi:hypothetical protein